MHFSFCEDSGTQINTISILGLWSLEIAHDYPNCQVIGIDVVPPSEKEGWNLATVSSFNTSSSLSAGQLKKETNVKFQYGDILQTLMFPDNHFDLVYQRDVATVLPFKLWPSLISEFFRVTKSGGQIQLVEYGMIYQKHQHYVRIAHAVSFMHRSPVQKPWSRFNSSQ